MKKTPKKPQQIWITNQMIRGVIFTAYFLISEFPEKLLAHFRKTSSVTIKLTTIWCNTIEIILVIAIIKLQ